MMTTAMTTIMPPMPIMPTRTTAMRMTTTAMATVRMSRTKPRGW